MQQKIPTIIRLILKIILPVKCLLLTYDIGYILTEHPKRVGTLCDRERKTNKYIPITNNFIKNIEL